LTNEQILIAVLDALHASHIPYMVTGSLASNLYGIPRSTMDIDLIIAITDESLIDMTSALPSDFHLDPQITFEAVTGTTRYTLEIPDHNYKAELFLLSDDPHDKSRFARRHARPLVGREVYIPTPEDVIISKLRWYLRAKRGKDWDDARDVLAVQQNGLDFDYIRRWCIDHNTLGLFEELLREIPRM